MGSTLTETKTLTGLRKSAGFSLEEAAKLAGAFDAKFPRSHVGMRKIEINGTTDWWKIQALAKLYNVKPDEMANIVRPKIKE